jgi:hypothetical protein
MPQTLFIESYEGSKVDLLIYSVPLIGPGGRSGPRKNDADMSGDEEEVKAAIVTMCGVLDDNIPQP